MPRSGSTWSFNACLGLLKSAYTGSVTGFYSENIGEVLTEPAAELLVVKCHAVDAAGLEVIGKMLCRCVYTHRDPREAVASMMQFAGATFDAALQSIVASLEFFTFQRRFGTVLTIAYPDLVHRPRECVEKIAAYLKIPNATIDAVAETYSREALAEIARSVETFAPPDVYRDTKYLYHRATLIHRDHFSGVGNMWSDILSGTQVHEIYRQTRFWAETLGWITALGGWPKNIAS
jgi:hypothetical protein